MHGTNQRNEHDSTKRSIRLTPPCLPEKRKSGTEARHVETHVVAAAGDYRHTEQGVQQECITSDITGASGFIACVRVDGWVRRVAGADF